MDINCDGTVTSKHRYIFHDIFDEQQVQYDNSDHLEHLNLMVSQTHAALRFDVSDTPYIISIYLTELKPNAPVRKIMYQDLYIHMHLFNDMMYGNFEDVDGETIGVYYKFKFEYEDIEKDKIQVGDYTNPDGSIEFTSFDNRVYLHFRRHDDNDMYVIDTIYKRVIFDNKMVDVDWCPTVANRWIEFNAGTVAF